MVDRDAAARSIPSHHIRAVPVPRPSVRSGSVDRQAKTDRRPNQWSEQASVWFGRVRIMWVPLPPKHTEGCGRPPPPPRSMGWVVDARPAAAKRLRAQAATTTSAHSSSRGRLRRPGAPAAAGRPSLAFGCEESIPKIGGRVSGRARLHLPPATHGAGGPGASPLTNASSKACEG